MAGALSLLRPSGLHLAAETVPLGKHIELDPIWHAELVVDAAEMVAQRVFADVQVAREPLVVDARLRHESTHDLMFALGQRIHFALCRVDGLDVLVLAR